MAPKLRRPTADESAAHPSWDAPEPAARYVPQDLDDGLSAEIFLPIHGLVRLSPRELRVIDHPAFQRLCEIHQLGQTLLVFRGARHARGEHGIGSVAAVTLMAHALKRNGATDLPLPSRNWKKSTALNGHEFTFLRLGALLHDIGHLPAGHTLEDELGLLPPHDEQRRLKIVFDQREWHGRLYDSLAERVNFLYRKDAAALALIDDQRGTRLTAREITIRLMAKDGEKTALRPREEQAAASPYTMFRIGVLRDLIGNTLCADLIDYLHRDWWHIGKVRSLDLRLLDYLEVRTRVPSATKPREHNLVVNLGNPEKPRLDAVTAIIDLLESRYQLAEIALFHRTKLIAAAMLERVIAEYEDSFVDPEDTLEGAASRSNAAPTLLSAGQSPIERLERILLTCTDEEAYIALANLLEVRAVEVSSPQTRIRLRAAADLARRLRVRHLHKEFDVQWNPPSSDWVKERYSADASLPSSQLAEASRTASRNRLLTCRALERDFQLAPCSVAMYCPPAKMNSKIAAVNVLWNGVSRPLHEVDQAVARGHLKSQVERFESMWRVTFSIDRRTRFGLKTRGRLDRLKDLILLGVLSPRNGSDAALRRLAIAEYGDAKLVSGPAHEQQLAAFVEREELFYPSENPTLFSFLSDQAIREQRTAEEREPVTSAPSTARMPPDDDSSELPLSGLPTPVHRSAAQNALRSMQGDESEFDSRIDNAVVLSLVGPLLYPRLHDRIRELEGVAAPDLAADDALQTVRLESARQAIQELAPNLMNRSPNGDAGAS